MDAFISPRSLAAALYAPGSAERPLVIDVRRGAAYAAATDTIAGSLRRDPQAIDAWCAQLPPAARVVVYCVHGHQVSQDAARELSLRGVRAQFLEHGLKGWREAGGGLGSKPAGASTRWVTRARPKIDRIACPWLVRRFIDRDAAFLYVPASEVHAVAAARTAVPYDVPQAALGHVGERCSFDAFLAHFRLDGDPALQRLATIVRGADTGHPELAPQSAGLLAISLGLSRSFGDDHEMLEHGMVIYDALYHWCREGQDERHTWNLDPDAGRTRP